MTLCRLLEILATVVALLAMLPWVLNRLASSSVGKYLSRYCGVLCRVWIVLALLAGIVLGGLLVCCWHELRHTISCSCCALTVLALLLAIVMLYRLLLAIARCGFIDLPLIPNPFAKPTEKREAKTNTGGSFTLRINPFLLVVLLALLLWWLVRHCCGHHALAYEGHAICVRLLYVAAVLVVLYAAVRFLSIRLCGDPGAKDCYKLVVHALWLAIVALLIALIVMWRCCDKLGAEDNDLALAGIWWEGAHGDEAGAHLRIAFRVTSDYGPGLAFPEDGFDLERRVNGGAWRVINSQRLFPVNDWGNEAAPTAGDMALRQAIERLHPSDWARMRGQPFADLLSLLTRAPYDTLFYVTTPAPAVYGLAPANPYLTRAARSAYLTAYYSATPGANPPPLMTWELVPLPTLITIAVHPEMARVLGLLYVDKTASPDTTYDYRVTGYWHDQTRRYTLEGLSRASTAPLDNPVITDATSPVHVGPIGPDGIVDDHAVALTWAPPSGVPVVTGMADRIEPVLYVVQHQLLSLAGAGGAVTACTPAAATGTWVAPLRDRMSGNAAPADTVEPVMLAPIPDTITNQLLWPRHFFLHPRLEYGCHAYRVYGRDMFGRTTAYSAPVALTVRDGTPPPPPTFVNVNLFQKGDPKLDPAIKSVIFPAGSTHQVYVRVTWLWPIEQDEQAPDLDHFLLYAGLPNFHPTNRGGPVDPPWTVGANWTAQELLGPIPLTTQRALPPELVDAGVPTTTRCYETTFTEQDLAAANVTLAQLGLDAGDARPVCINYIGVASVDGTGNKGRVSAPSATLAKDVTPPSPPAPPQLVGEPSGIDRSGKRGLQLTWTGSPLYTYLLYRVQLGRITIDANAGGADVMPCLDPSPPARPTGMTNAEYADVVRKYRARATVWEQRDALVNAETLERVNAIPVDVSSGSASITDQVDGRVSGEYVYCAVAIDSAGNMSTLSCPSDVILVEDGVPPRAPVVQTVVGGQERVELTWVINTEPDIDRYHVYRASAPEDTTSRRRMRWIASFAKTGVDVVNGASMDGQPDPDTPDASTAGTGNYETRTFRDETAKPGRMYYYRLAAADLVGNQSQLSPPFVAVAIDTIPPVKPVWHADPATVGMGGPGLPRVRLWWAPAGGEPDLQYLVKCREKDKWAWKALGTWTDAGADSSVLTSGLKFGKHYFFRVRAMDPTGNRGAWSDSLEVDVR